MKVNKVYAVTSSSRLEEAHAWYSRLFDRPADLHPMANVYEWHFGSGGVQLVDDAQRAGSSMLTVIVPDLDALRASLESRRLTLGPPRTAISPASRRSRTATAIRSPSRSLVRRKQPRSVASFFSEVSLAAEDHAVDRLHRRRRERPSQRSTPVVE
jgi:hypothetical protein